jgi:oxygen-dependent protoporphyrinogen oxidase
MPEGMMLIAPTMILPFLRSTLVSWPGKIRMGMEVLVPARHSDEDESLGSFVRRRLGSEALNKIAAPLIGGIHAADPETLSLRSTFPMFLDMEKKHGSILRAMIRRPRPAASNGAAKPPMFMTLRGGLKQLAEAIVAQLPQSSLRTGCSVVSIHPGQDRYNVVMCDGRIVEADDLVFATPAYIAADLLQNVDSLLASRLRAIRYVSTATVSLGFRRSDIKHPMQGAGFIVPRTEGRHITACSWSSQKFARRAPDDSVLLRVFVGGAGAEDLAEQDESTLIELARAELRTIMDINAEPVIASASRWRKGNPQYELDHERRIREIEAELTHCPGIHLAGAAYRGSGIPDCIQSGIKAANAVAARHQTHLVPVCTGT